MDSKHIDRNEIFERIRAGELRPEEGLALIKEMHREMHRAPETPAPATPGPRCFRWSWHVDDSDARGAARPAGLALVYGPDDERCQAIVAELGAQLGYGPVIHVRQDTAYRSPDLGRAAVRSSSMDDHRRLLQELPPGAGSPRLVVHVGEDEPGLEGARDPGRPLDRDFFSLLAVSRAVAETRPEHPVPLLHVYRAGQDGEQPLHAALAGLARVVRTELPACRCRVVAVDSAAPGGWAEAIAREAGAGDHAVEIRYAGGRRHVRRLAPVELPAADRGAARLRERGVYLITGGLGGLGRIIARHLAGEARARLVLTGRAALRPEHHVVLDELQRAGGEVLYEQGDVSRPEDVARWVDVARQRFGALHGVIHSAGVVDDARIIHKEPDRMRAVLAPKVHGTLCLDRATRDLDLDLFVLFSSVSGAVGTAGQCDYAYANRFMDSFAAWRRAQGRPGRSLSIAWPLWAEGGMGVDDEARAALIRSGWYPLATRDGVQTLVRGLAADEPALVVVHATAEALARVPDWDRGTPPRRPAAAPPDHSADRDRLVRWTENKLRELLAQQIGVPPARIRPTDPLEEYGIDSLMIRTMARALEERFGDMPVTLFFEYQTLAELAGYLVDHHRDAIVEQGASELGLSAPSPASPAIPAAPAAPATPAPPATIVQSADPRPAPAATSTDVAIVGLAGRYPMAPDLEAFWANLKAGRDCVTEIPADRWDYRDYYHPEKGRPGATYSKWGGFLDDIAAFDPLFFHISPSDAEVTDPQERLFLETAWQTLEDAAYTRATLDRFKLGVFVGLMYSHYQLFGVQGRDAPPTTSSFASVANRVSYFLGARGPSIAVDTMCSSALTAIHLACRSLTLGECDVALAGGVNLMPHPYKYVQLSHGRFVSSDGRCRAFGEGGDGYVPGEGVGAVLLKSLPRALEDGDHIYAVIKATAVNHGGKTNGYTVPSPVAQGELIATTLRAARCEPADIDYVEAHGTGTSLGDPIEIAGLVKAFGTDRVPAQSRPIGSVKSNIGHLESAAGVASLTKVLLQLRHRQLVPSIHTERLNPDIDFGRTPFYVQRRLDDWAPPRATAEAPDRAGPRRALISSFGAGGSNTCMIIEEHVDRRERRPAQVAAPQIVVLSAQAEDRLVAYAERLLRFLTGQPVHGAGAHPGRALDHERVRDELSAMVAALADVDARAIDPTHDLAEQGLDLVDQATLASRIQERYGASLSAAAFTERSSIDQIAHYLVEGATDLGFDPDTVRDDLDLADLAHTLQVGREPMAERLAIVTTSVPDLADKLRAFCSGRRDLSAMYRGTVRRGAASLDDLVEGRAGQEFLRILSDEGDHHKIARLWASGVNIDWTELSPPHGGPGPRRIPLPTYPFRRERYWPAIDDTPAAQARLHPLVEANVSTLDEVRMATRFQDSDPHLRDGELPALTVIELARAACHIAGRSATRAENLVWGPAMRATDGVLDLHIALYPDHDAVAYEVRGHDVIYGQGWLRATSEQPGALDIAAVRSRCQRVDPSVAPGAGPGHDAIVRDLWIGPGEALATLALPALEAAADDMVLHPALQRGVFAALTAWRAAAGQPAQGLAPARLARVDIAGGLADALAATVYAHLHSTGQDQLDLVIADPEGAAIARLTGLELAPTAPLIQAAPAPAPRAAPMDDQELAAQVQRHLRQRAASVIKIGAERLDIDTNLGDYGFESVTFVSLTDQVNQDYGIDITPAVFFERGTVRALADYLIDHHGPAMRARHAATAGVPSSQPGQPGQPGQRPGGPAAPRPLQPLAPRITGGAPRGMGNEPIAIVGMSGRYPGSPDLEAFWQNLRDEKDLITEIPPERWDWRAFHPDAGGPYHTRVRWGGFINDIDKFDARFFKISPKEAEMMDPQQRLLLETVWEAIEDWGHKATELAGRRVGLFAGVQFRDYQQCLTEQGIVNPQMGLGNEHSILVNRISYLLDIHGPSEPYNTACSSALVAVHRAVRSIRSGESELAIAGGVTLMLSPWTTISGDSLGILSPDGRCKTLDSSANGYVRGEGVGALVLRPLRKALEDRDPIYAVIRGTAVNHGGKAPSLTAPNSEAQAALLVQAYQEADMDPDTISYLELHGTGTKLGDPVEIEGIKSAFRTLAEQRGRPASQQTCGIGSVKTNIGHLEPVAGLAGLTKLILCMKHRTLPGILHLETLNPYIKLEQTPFQVVERTRPWQPLRTSAGEAIPRRAGVSSFGFGGVNAHVVLEEHTPPARPAAPEAEQLIVLSARTEERLRAYAQRLAQFLDRELAAGSAPGLGDIAYTLQVGRVEMEERLALVVSSVATLRDRLTGFAAGQRAPGVGVYQGHAGSDAGLSDETDLHRLAQHWSAGGQVAWERLYPTPPSRVSLPTYPFERRRFWALENPPGPLATPAAPEGATAPAPAPASAPAGATSDADIAAAGSVVGEIIAEELKMEPDELDPDIPLADYGVDSVLGTAVIQRLRQEVGDFVELTALEEYPTLRALSGYLAEASGGDQPAAQPPRARPAQPAPARPKPSPRAKPKLPPELIALNRRGDLVPSFWVHGGPGHAAIYNSLARALSPDCPFYAFQARGADGLAIPPDFEEMVSHYIDCVRIARPRGPYIIGGYSYGGLVAYEMARRMHEAGDPIHHLILFDTIPPVQDAFDLFFDYYTGHNDGSEHFMMLMMANELAGARHVGKPFFTHKDIMELLPGLRVPHLAHEAKRRSNTMLSADQIFGYIQGCITLGAFTEHTYIHYRPLQNGGKPYTGSDLLYIKARVFLEEDSWVGAKPGDVFANYDYVEPWRRLVGRNVEVVEPGCDHFGLAEEPALQITGPAIRKVFEP